MGHLSRDPEMRYTAGGLAVTSFTIATSWGSGEKRKTEWHNCVIWNGKVIPWAEQAAKMHKGDLVYATGRLETRSWEGTDGQKRRSTEIQCNELHYMRSAGQGNNTNEDDSTFPGLVEARKNLTDDSNEPPF
jgi:single-strand DNA-binding protein